MSSDQRENEGNEPSDWEKVVAKGEEIQVGPGHWRFLQKPLSKEDWKLYGIAKSLGEEVLRLWRELENMKIHNEKLSARLRDLEQWLGRCPLSSEGDKE